MQLARFFISQGYKPKQITVLAPYQGQAAHSSEDNRRDVLSLQLGTKGWCKHVLVLELGGREGGREGGEGRGGEGRGGEGRGEPVHPFRITPDGVQVS